MFDQIVTNYPRLLDLLQRSCGLSRADAAQCVAARRYGHPYRADPSVVIGRALRSRNSLRTLRLAA